MAADVDLEKLYDEHAQGLFAYLLNLTRSEHNTRDLLQELFIKIARQPGLLHGIHNERAFLIRLAHNIALDWFRRNRAREKYHDIFAEQPARQRTSVRWPARQRKDLSSPGPGALELKFAGESASTCRDWNAGKV